jgi:hypothetical protein
MREGKITGTLDRAAATPEAVMALAVGFAADATTPSTVA